MDILDLIVISNLEADLGKEASLQLVEIFIVDLESTVNVLDTVKIDHDLKLLNDTTHILKNSAALFGAAALAAEALRLNDSTELTIQDVDVVSTSLSHLCLQTLGIYKDYLKNQQCN